MNDFFIFYHFFLNLSQYVRIQYHFIHMNHQNRNRSQHPVRMRPSNTFGARSEQNQNLFMGPYQSQFIYPREEIEIQSVRLNNGVSINYSDLASLTQIKSNSQRVLGLVARITMPTCQGCSRIRRILESGVDGLNKLCQYTFETFQEQQPLLNKQKIEKMNKKYNQFQNCFLLQLINPYLNFFVEQFERKIKSLSANLNDQFKRIEVKEQCFYYEIDYQKNKEREGMESLMKKNTQKTDQLWKENIDKQKQRWAAEKHLIESDWRTKNELMKTLHEKTIKSKQQQWRNKEKKLEARVKILKQELEKVRNQLDQCKISLEIYKSQNC